MCSVANLLLCGLPFQVFCGQSKVNAPHFRRIMSIAKRLFLPSAQAGVFFVV